MKPPILEVPTHTHTHTHRAIAHNQLTRLYKWSNMGLPPNCRKPHKFWLSFPYLLFVLGLFFFAIGPSSALSHPFLGEGSPAKLDYRRKWVPKPLKSGGPSRNWHPPNGFFSFSVVPSARSRSAACWACTRRRRPTLRSCRTSGKTLPGPEERGAFFLCAPASTKMVGPHNGARGSGFPSKVSLERVVS